MRIVSWNVNHRASRKLIPDSMPAALLSLKPDVLVLTEYVPTDLARGHSFLGDALRAGGLRHMQMSPQGIGRHNRVLLASVAPLLLGASSASEPDHHATSNWLHVTLPTFDMEVIGLRVPSYSKSDASTYWKSFESTMRELAGRRIVIIGDINADPHGQGYPGTAHLHRIVESGWHLPNPTGEWSYWSSRGKVFTSRIDHALISPALRVADIRYVDASDGHVFAGPGENAMSDHAALLVEVDLEHA